MATYAVKIAGRWWIAKKAKAADYSLADTERDVWCDVSTTALLGYIGDGERAVELEAE